MENWLAGKIRLIRRDHMLKRRLGVVGRTVRIMGCGMFRKPAEIAMDRHLVCGYDKLRKLVNVIKPKPKNQTCNFNCLATANCIADGSRAFLAAKLSSWKCTQNPLHRG